MNGRIGADGVVGGLGVGEEVFAELAGVGEGGGGEGMFCGASMWVAMCSSAAKRTTTPVHSPM